MCRKMSYFFYILPKNSGIADFKTGNKSVLAFIFCHNGFCRPARKHLTQYDNRQNDTDHS